MFLGSNEIHQVLWWFRGSSNKVSIHKMGISMQIRVEFNTMAKLILLWNIIPMFGGALDILRPYVPKTQTSSAPILHRFYHVQVVHRSRGKHLYKYVKGKNVSYCLRWKCSHGYWVTATVLLLKSGWELAICQSVSYSIIFKMKCKQLGKFSRCIDLVFKLFCKTNSVDSVVGLQK